MNKKFIDFDPDVLLKELGIGDMPEEDKEEVLSTLMAYMQNVIFETVVSNLSDEQLREFKESVDKQPEDLEEKIMKITANVPGLSEKIEQAVASELASFKAARAHLN